MIFDAILNISKESLKRKSKLFISIFFCFSGFLYSSDIQRVQLPSKDLTVVSIYEDIILTTSTKSIAALSMSGHVDWTVTSNSRLSLVGCRFNTALILDESATLRAYDVFQGLSLWSVKDRNIKSVSISFPYIVYKTHSGRLGAVDFLTGQPLWETEDIGVSSFMLLGRTSTILVLTHDMAYSVDITTGVISPDTLPFLMEDRFVSSWNNGALIQRGDQFFTYSVSDMSLNPVNVLLNEPFESFEQYHQVVLSGAHEIKLINVLTSNIKRVFHYEKPIKLFTINDGVLYSITENNELHCKDIYTGQEKHKPIVLPKLTLSQGFHVYTKQKKCVIYTPFELINITY